LGNSVIETVNAAKIFEDTIINIGNANDKVVFISADSYRGTGGIKFKNRFPNRFFEFGVAEQNACSHAAGMALMGMKPFFATIATFATMRCFEQIRDDVVRHNLNVIIVGRGAGLSYSMQGPTHVSIDEIGVLRILPGITIFDPVDIQDFRNILVESVQLSGPVYIREHKKLPLEIKKKTENNKIGDPEIIQEGDDLTIISSGVMVKRSLLASELLREKGINSELISISKIKPLNKDKIIKSLKKNNKVVTIEEHSILNGLGSTIAEIVAEECNVKLLRLGINDSFAIDGPYEDVLKHYGLDVNGIVERIEYFWSKN
jgi:transketolase